MNRKIHFYIGTESQNIVKLLKGIPDNAVVEDVSFNEGSSENGDNFQEIIIEFSKVKEKMKMKDSPKNLDDKQIKILHSFNDFADTLKGQSDFLASLDHKNKVGNDYPCIHFEDKKTNKYLRPIKTSNEGTIDVYDVLEIFEVKCPARQHAVKKLLCAGIRGKGDTLQDLEETAGAIQRAIELEKNRNKLGIKIGE